MYITGKQSARIFQANTWTLVLKKHKPQELINNKNILNAY
jgi:hypothetical protein